jgi:AcrR family transcriptional regulator
MSTSGEELPMTLRAAPAPGRRLPRAERREQILAAATGAFAAAGFAATSLDDVAAQAGISRAILYRHFDSKTGLYRAVLDRVCARLAAAVGESPGAFTDAAVDALLTAAAADPGGFRLLFQHVAREPEFRDFAEGFQAGIVTAAHQQIAGLVPDQAWAQWAAQLAPTIAIEAITAWLDVGQPDPRHAGQRIRHAIAAVIQAAQQA